MRRTQDSPYLVTDETISKIVTYLLEDERAAAPFEPLGYMMHRDEYIGTDCPDEAHEIISNCWACEQLAEALYNLNRVALRNYLGEESDSYGGLIIDYDAPPPTPAGFCCLGRQLADQCCRCGVDSTNKLYAALRKSIAIAAAEIRD